MSTKIVLPDDLTQRLQAQAISQRLSLNELVVEVLTRVFEPRQDVYPTLEQIVAEIKSMEPNPANFHPATQSLADLLINSPDDPSFDLKEWNREWAITEQNF
jgi:hypothetical protein